VTKPQVRHLHSPQRVGRVQGFSGNSLDQWLRESLSEGLGVCGNAPQTTDRDQDSGVKIKPSLA